MYREVTNKISWRLWYFPGKPEKWMIIFKTDSK